MGMEGRQGFADLRLDEEDGVPFLVNLHSDPQLSEKVKYRVREGDMTVGSGPDCDIQLGGVYILDVHCTLHCQQFRGGDGPAAKGGRQSTGVPACCVAQRRRPWCGGAKEPPPAPNHPCALWLPCLALPARSSSSRP
jgi:hypothetical protein